MTKKTPVFVLTVRNSQREFEIKKRLNFLKISFKFFYAINGRNVENFKILDTKYDKKKCINRLGREMTYTEISNAEGHLRIYKYIVKKNIFNAVIMEDDCYSSEVLPDWLKLYNFFKRRNYDIIQIYHSSGLVYKKPLEVILNKFYLYKTCFTLPYTTCYQITKKACKYILNRNKKISRLVDWPVNFYDGKLKQFIVLPRLTSLHFNHLNTSYNIEAWKNFGRIEKIRRFIPFYNFITALYFLFHIPFLLRKYKNYSYYKEKYLLPKIFFIKELFSNNYINLKNIQNIKGYEKK